MSSALPNSFRSGPDERGHFGIFGGRFVAETLMPLILDLEQAYADAKADPAFQVEMDGYLKHYVGRPSPLYLAERLTEHLGGQVELWAKREDCNSGLAFGGNKTRKLEYLAADALALAPPLVPHPRVPVALEVRRILAAIATVVVRSLRSASRSLSVCAVGR